MDDLALRCTTYLHLMDIQYGLYGWMYLHDNITGDIPVERRELVPAARAPRVKTNNN